MNEPVQIPKWEYIKFIVLLAMQMAFPAIMVWRAHLQSALPD
jgi:hypothetical protein